MAPRVQVARLLFGPARFDRRTSALQLREALLQRLPAQSKRLVLGCRQHLPQSRGTSPAVLRDLLFGAQDGGTHLLQFAGYSRKSTLLNGFMLPAHQQNRGKGKALLHDQEGRLRSRRVASSKEQSSAVSWRRKALSAGRTSSARSSCGSLPRW